MRAMRGRWWTGSVTKPPKTTTLVVVPTRWMVERTVAWLGTCRRLSKDYEPTIASATARIRLTMIGLMLRRLKPTL